MSEVPGGGVRSPACFKPQDRAPCEDPADAELCQAELSLRQLLSASTESCHEGEAPLGLQEDAPGGGGSSTGSTSSGHDQEIAQQHPAHRGGDAVDDVDDGWPDVQPDLAWEEGAHYTLVPPTAERGGLYYSPHCDDEYTLQAIRSHSNLFYFSNDLPERYSSFCADWGPVNISLIMHFCNEIRAKWEHPRLKRRPIVYYSSPDPQGFTNTAMMLAVYLMLDHGFSPEDAILPFARIGPTPFEGFRDATWAKSTFDLHPLSCIKGLKRAVDLGWLGARPVDDFDVAEYDMYDQPCAFNLNCITPKFVAFLGPQDRVPGLPWGPFQHEPGEYVQEFLRRGVRAVVRLNEANTYDKATFERHGIAVHDLEFQDCTTPSPDIVRRFLDCVDGVDGPVAVHCLAGLGRTGTLIGVHMMKHNGFTAREAIGYIRLMRPGSVIGPQQQYLEKVQRARWEGNVMALPEQDWGVQVGAVDSCMLASDVAKAVRSGRRPAANA